MRINSRPFVVACKVSNQKLQHRGRPRKRSRSLPNGENCMGKLSDADLDRLINGRASGDNADSEQKAADNWLTAFSKKSEEALAKRDAETKAEPRPDDKVLIERLAWKDHTEYDRMRAGLAETLGIRVGTLDEKVEALRKKLEKEDDQDALPH